MLKMLTRPENRSRKETMKSCDDNLGGITQQRIAYQVAGATWSPVENLCSTVTIFMEPAVVGKAIG